MWGDNWERPGNFELGEILGIAGMNLITDFAVEAPARFFSEVISEATCVAVHPHIKWSVTLRAPRENANNPLSVIHEGAVG